MLDKTNRINYRIDVGFRSEGRTIAIGVGEASTKSVFLLFALVANVGQFKRIN